MYNADFSNDITLAFREQFKADFYAYCYGSYKAQLQFNDFFCMMCAGNEI